MYINRKSDFDGNINNNSSYGVDANLKFFKNLVLSSYYAASDDTLSKKTTEEWLTTFAGSVPASPIYNIGEAMNNPFVSERDAIHHFPNPANPETSFKMVAHPIRSSGDEPLNKPAPRLGENTNTLLAEIGYTNDQIKKLKDKGVI
mgnify:CR=1 FL=1